jgi:hypothetical protein
VLCTRRACGRDMSHPQATPRIDVAENDEPVRF